MNELTQSSLRLRIEWVPKVVTTDPPELIPHTEWSLAIHLNATSPIRAAVLIFQPEEILWGLYASAPSDVVELSLKFFPLQWKTSDAVRVSFEWQSVDIVDPNLKSDPRQVLTLDAPDTGLTGRIVSIASLHRHRLALGVLPLAQQDIESRRHGRWRVKPELTEDLPSDLRDLSGGQQHGTAARAL